MRSLLTRTLLLGGTVAAAGLLTATTALAHPAPFTVTAGSAGSGTAVAVTGTSGAVAFKDTKTGVTLNCTASSLKGSITTGSSNGTPVATVNGTGASFSNCTGPAGLKFAVTGYGTWNINITDSTSGVSTGTVTNIRAHVVSTAGPTCAFDVGSNTGSFVSSGTSTVNPGTVAGNYTNSSQNLAVPAVTAGSLGLWNVHGSGTTTYCVAASVLAQGDPASFSATYKIVADVAANNPVAIN
ncbi:hypothetical protein SAMN05443575_0985 [Jatrophihabitans endophyticus]|uniref:Neocarzinostatin family protein n=1 Tax=Jatrophihabitans endophyticus TaxID=1206085 RepID=A0A1M5ES80_9ACTN|nr:hypothetical protein [Jatrophihabitans endophyticus]SHF82079.1 hypothetical protein SAMN05443575_0985 [Jatrophihabitans endophyticus]